ncbi:MAG: PriCT-2 domain-containing protein, partial [Candidatus Fonsibacter sp.]
KKKARGPFLHLYEEVSKRSKQYKTGECYSKWRSFNRKCHTIGSPFISAKDGNPNMLERGSPNLHMNKKVVHCESNAT